MNLLCLYFITATYPCRSSSIGEVKMTASQRRTQSKEKGKKASSIDTTRLQSVSQSVFEGKKKLDKWCDSFSCFSSFWTRSDIACWEIRFFFYMHKDMHSTSVSSIRCMTAFNCTVHGHWIDFDAVRLRRKANRNTVVHIQSTIHPHYWWHHLISYILERSNIISSPMWNWNHDISMNTSQERKMRIIDKKTILNTLSLLKHSCLTMHELIIEWNKPKLVHQLSNS
jgi:hypothetical protein